MRYLGAWHEVGHLQTLPVVAGLTLGLSAAMMGSSGGLGRRAAALAGVLAAWELASEVYVVSRIGWPAYRHVYARSMWRLTVFWLGSALALAVGLRAAFAGRGARR
jgi:hypothetical protein